MRRRLKADLKKKKKGCIIFFVIDLKDCCSATQNAKPGLLGASLLPEMNQELMTLKQNDTAALELMQKHCNKVNLKKGWQLKKKNKRNQFSTHPVCSEQLRPLKGIGMCSL